MAVIFGFVEYNTDFTVSILKYKYVRETLIVSLSVRTLSCFYTFFLIFHVKFYCVLPVRFL